MRVIIGLPEWSLSGVAVFAAHLARGLNTQGWESRILLTQSHTDDGSHSGAFELPADIPVERLPILPTDDWDIRWDALIRYLEEHAPCIYLPNYDWRMSVVSPRLSSRVTIVGMLHTDLPVDYDHVRRLGQYWNAIVGVSETIRYNIISNTPHFAERTAAIPYGVPIADALPTRLSEGPLKIIYHGALRYQQKRVFDLIRIAEGLERRGVPFQLTIAGGGPAREELQERARSLIERGLVSFMPTLPNVQLVPLLAQQDVFLLTSEYEGLPLSLLEAMGHGCVPVVSDLPTLSPPLQNGVNGFRVTVGHYETFVERLTDLARNPARRQTMAAAAYETVASGSYRVEDMVRAYTNLFERVQTQAQRGLFQRPFGLLQAPPAYVGAAQILPGDHTLAEKKLNALTMFPNPPRGPVPPSPARVSTSSRNLQDYQIIFGTLSGRIGGVDTFAIQLARELIRRGWNVSVLFTLRARELTQFPDLPSDIPIRYLDVARNASWHERWKATLKFLHANAPCFYLPNYDWRHSAVSPKLSDHVKVVGIAHSDDPQHYEHIVRLGRYWDAIVGVSRAIADEIQSLDPTLTPRLHMIPYGIPLPSHPPVRPPRPDNRLRIVYAGRLVQHQKRVLDLVQITRGLLEREIPFEMTVVGDGLDQSAFLAQAADLTANYQLRPVGKLSNEALQQLFANSDVLVLTSAFEGLPVSMLEAMAQGCVPVVTHIRSGVPDIIRDGENGFIVPIAGIDAFVEQLGFLARNPALLECMSQAAYTTIRDNGYRLEEMTDRYIRLFREVLTQDYLRPAGKIKPPPNLTGKAVTLGYLPAPVRGLYWRVRRALKGQPAAD